MSVYAIATTDKIRVTTGAAVTSIKVQGSYAQCSASTGAVGGVGIIKNSITTATDTDVLTGPGSGNFYLLKELTVRNTDTSLACDVTVSFNDNGTIYEKYKATLNPGDVLEYAEGAGWILLRNVSYLDKMLIVSGSDVSNSTTTFADITGLTVNLKAGVRYAIEAWLHIISAATTTGVQVGFNIGAAPTVAEFTASAVVTNSATAAAESTGEVNARDTNVITQTTGPAAIGPMNFGGVIQPSADGTFAMRLRSEVGASAVTVKVGSYMRVVQEH